MRPLANSGSVRAGSAQSGINRGDFSAANRFPLRRKCFDRPYSNPCDAGAPADFTDEPVEEIEPVDSLALALACGAAATF